MTHPDSGRPGILIGLIVVQTLCAAFFLWDVLIDIQFLGAGAAFNLHIAIESMAALALTSAIIVEARFLLRLLARKAHLESQVSIAAGAFHDIMLAHFDAWGLTPSERDVALFVIKGLSIAEAAALRGSAEGTVKSQLNAVYRKAGVSGRSALLGLLIDDLVSAPLIAPASSAHAPR